MYLLLNAMVHNVYVLEWGLSHLMSVALSRSLSRALYSLSLARYSAMALMFTLPSSVSRSCYNHHNHIIIHV